MKAAAVQGEAALAGGMAQHWAGGLWPRPPLLTPAETKQGREIVQGAFVRRED